MLERVELRDGTVGWVWPLLPMDRAALAREFETLSPESRRRRFLGPVAHLSEAMLRHLVDEVDGVDHVALVLMAELGDELVPTAVARCVRYANQPEAADVAVTVKDEWQGKGVASALLDILMRHRPAGVTHLLTEVAADNPASLAMLKRLGEVRTFDPGTGVFDVEVELPPSDGRWLAPDEPGERLHEVLKDPDRERLRARDLVCPWLRPDDELDGDAQRDTPGDTQRDADELTPGDRSSSSTRA